MLETIVLTIIGNDRPGLIDVLSGKIAEHGGNWEESRMAHLASKFAGILLVRVPAANVDGLLGALQALDEEGVMHVTAERSAPVDSGAGTAVRLDLTGQDHPGIVHHVSHALATLGVTIDELETETRTASMSGEPLFVARALVVLPDSVEVAGVREALESLADDLMVDVAVEGKEHGLRS